MPTYSYVVLPSSWDEYAAEVRSGRLEWSPVHRSDKFWVRCVHMCVSVHVHLTFMYHNYIHMWACCLMLVVLFHIHNFLLYTEINVCQVSQSIDVAPVLP